MRCDGDDEDLCGFDNVEQVVRELAKHQLSNMSRDGRTTLRKFKNQLNGPLELIDETISESG